MEKYLPYVNISGRDLFFIFKGQKYVIKAWRNIDLPEDMYEFIKNSKISLELNYELIIQQMEEDKLNSREMVRSYYL